MRASADGMPMEQRVGRFSLVLPTVMQRSGQEHMLRSSVHLQEVEWTAGRGCDEAWWDCFLKLAERRAPPSARGSILEERELSPRCRAVLAHDTEYEGSARTWFALLDAGTHGVWLECVQDPRTPEAALSKLEAVARSYRVLETRDLGQPADGFYLERGAVTLPAQGAEQAIVQFDGAPLELKLELCVRAALDADPQGGLLTRFQRALAMGLHGDMRVHPIRKGPRVVAGFMGEELIVQMEDEHDERLAWAWSCPGRADDPHAPRVEFSMSSTGRLLEAEAHLWEVTLESLRYRQKPTPMPTLE